MAKKNKQQAVQEATETLNKQEAFFLKYKKPILYAVLVLILIIVGILLYKNYVSGPREEKASTELAKGQEYFNAGQWDKALKGDGAGFAGLLKVADEYGSTKAGNLANLYAGLSYANQEKWNDAIKYLESFSPKGDMMISPAATAALGNAYAHVNKLDKAVDKLKKAAKMADSKAYKGVNNSISPTCLLQAGELLESQGKKAEALKVYQDIKEKYVNAAISQEIDKYIERVSE